MTRLNLSISSISRLLAGLRHATQPVRAMSGLTSGVQSCLATHSSFTSGLHHSLGNRSMRRRAVRNARQKTAGYDTSPMLAASSSSSFRGATCRRTVQRPTNFVPLIGLARFVMDAFIGRTILSTKGSTTKSYFRSSLVESGGGSGKRETNDLPIRPARTSCQRHGSRFIHTEMRHLFSACNGPAPFKLRTDATRMYSVLI
jgi:hypothetical protein